MTQNFKFGNILEVWLTPSFQLSPVKLAKKHIDSQGPCSLLQLLLNK